MPHRQQGYTTYIKSISVLITIALAASAGYAIRHTVSCFLSSFVIAYLLDPLVVRLEQKKLKRIYGIIILYVILSFLSIFIVIYLLPLLSSRWDLFVKNLPAYLYQAKELVLKMKLGLASSPGDYDWGWLLESATANIESISGKIGSGVYSAASSVAFNIFNIILAPILVFFMLTYKHEIISSIKAWLPLRQREHLLEVGREINASIGGYLRGQLIVSLIVAIFSTIALYLLDIDYPLLCGIFAGLASILPFVGVILATIPPLFFAYIKYQNGMILLKVLGAFSIIYFLEGYLVKPIVFKEAMNLNPLLTIIVVMAFGELMGFWGIMLAIPIAAAMKIFSVHWRRGDFQERA
jgi:putative permease